MRRFIFLIAALAALAASLLAGCGGKSSSSTASIPQASTAELTAAGLDELPLAPRSKRVDLEVPRFTHPTRITNPLFPISRLRSAILSGRVDDKPFHTETTLLPGAGVIEWPRGRFVRTLVSQYTAYLGGRLEEVALDQYAQADDGSVWYFGEHVFNYKDGAIADREGTWFAGDENPPAMIMPARPRVGDTYRPENVPGLVFEEVTVKSVGRTVAGPRGPVPGAIIARELHDDGSREDKTFAPGYGEFFTASGGDVEALALAVPTDSLSGPVPAELRGLESAALAAFDAIRDGRWSRASAQARRATAAWSAYRGSAQVPPRLEPEMRRAVSALSRAVRSRDRRGAGSAAIDVAQSALDLQLRHRPATAIDKERFGLWARQVLVDAAAGDESAVVGDVATMEWIRDRFAHSLAKADRIRLVRQLRTLRVHAGDGNLRAAAAAAVALVGED